MCLLYEKCNTKKPKKTKSKNHLNQEYPHKFVRSIEINNVDFLQVRIRFPI